MQPNSGVVDRMPSTLAEWEECRDGRCVFLRCYALMTGNMLAALDTGRFQDPEWVRELIYGFAGYYFRALDLYERGSDDTPAVWKRAHDLARSSTTTVMEDLLLGINAHVNHDLPLALADSLAAQWDDLLPDQRQARFDDHAEVNRVISETTDTVQTEVAQRYGRLLGVLDLAGGPFDEWQTGRYITAWRTDVWDLMLRLLEAKTPTELQLVREDIAALALARGELIFVGDALRVRLLGYPVRLLRKLRL